MNQSTDRPTDQWADTLTDRISESVGRSYERTNELTKKALKAEIESFTSVPRARISRYLTLALQPAALRASLNNGGTHAIS